MTNLLTILDHNSMRLFIKRKSRIVIVLVLSLSTAFMLIYFYMSAPSMAVPHDNFQDDDHVSSKMSSGEPGEKNVNYGVDNQIDNENNTKNNNKSKEEQDRINKEAEEEGGQMKKEEERKKMEEEEKSKGEENSKLDAAKVNYDLLGGVTPEDFIKGDSITQQFFAHILNLISRNHLSYPLERRMSKSDNNKPNIDIVSFHDRTTELLSEEQLREYFDFPHEFIKDLKVKHNNVVRDLPDFHPTFYKGNGYVIVGGGKYSWFAFLSIKTLRQLGSRLPVEIILPTKEDYEIEFCEHTLLSLNARCVEMGKVFGEGTLEKYDVKGYQYKAFALLASSFENAFLLDADSYPVNNPDSLFTSSLFYDYKMITWPDFWRRTTSPVFYEITGKPVGDKPVRHLNDFHTDIKYMKFDEDLDPRTDVPFHDRKGTIPDWSTESGEMLINKNVHFKTLLLALYYNFDGPFGYYPLLSQGGAGEGDKETFVAAASYLELKYYQVIKMPDKAYGWYPKPDEFKDSTIVQYDPLKDYENSKEVAEFIKKEVEKEGANFVYNYDKLFREFFVIKNSKPLFYHVHDPKMEPIDLSKGKLTYNPHDKKIRLFGEDFPRFGLDLETFLWETIDSFVCKSKPQLKFFEKQNTDHLCKEFIEEQLRFLKESSKTITDNFDYEKGVNNLKGSG